MAATCGVCGSECDTSGSSIKCAGNCDRFFHIKCVKLDGVKTRTVSKEWKCEECSSKKTPSLQSSSKSSTTSTSITKEFLVSTLEAFKREVFTELKSYAKQMEEFKQSMEFLSNNVDASNNLMAAIRKEYSEIKKQNEFIMQENKKLCDTVANLQVRVKDLEQYSRRNNIEISGIPITPKEDMLSVLKDIGIALGEELHDGQVAAAHRIPTFKQGRTPSIVVQFQSRIHRDSWIASYRKKKSLSANEVSKSFPSTRVYIGEHICPENKRFLSQLKEKCKEIDFKFAWFRDGKFYVRKAEGDKCHKIIKLEDLAKLT